MVTLICSGLARRNPKIYSMYIKSTRRISGWQRRRTHSHYTQNLTSKYVRSCTEVKRVEVWIYTHKSVGRQEVIQMFDPRGKKRFSYPREKIERMFKVPEKPHTFATDVNGVQKWVNNNFTHERFCLVCLPDVTIMLINLAWPKNCYDDDRNTPGWMKSMKKILSRDLSWRHDFVSLTRKCNQFVVSHSIRGREGVKISSSFRAVGDGETI